MQHKLMSIRGEALNSRRVSSLQATKNCLQNETFSDEQQRAKVSEYLKRGITTDAGYNAAVAELETMPDITEKHVRAVLGSNTRYDRSYHGTFQQLEGDRKQIKSFLQAECDAITCFREDLQKKAVRRLKQQYQSSADFQVYLQCVAPFMTFLDRRTPVACNIDAALHNIATKLVGQIGHSFARQLLEEFSRRINH
eukprot:PhM_4_TR17416/c4_g1_i4/m.82319